MRRDSSIPTYPLYNIKKGEGLASGASARLAHVRAARLAPVRALLKLYQAFVLELYQATLVIRVYRCSRTPQWLKSAEAYAYYSMVAVLPPNSARRLGGWVQTSSNPSALGYAGWPTQLMLNHAIKGLSRFWETCSD